MYAVVAPSLKAVYSSYSDIERVRALYPYAKVRKFKTEQECWEFLRRNGNNHTLDEVNNFGDTFSRRVVMQYFIREPNVYYNFDTSNIGTLRLVSGHAAVENRANLIKVIIPNLPLDNDTINGHIIAIYRGLALLGNFVDVEIIVPDHSILYAIKSYTGTNRVITRLRRHIDARVGNISITIRR